MFNNSEIERGIYKYLANCTSVRLKKERKVEQSSCGLSDLMKKRLEIVLKLLKSVVYYLALAAFDSNIQLLFIVEAI